MTASRRRFLRDWQDAVPNISQADIEQEIEATASAMRQLAGLAKCHDAGR
jgi:hypothetical protein